MKLRSTIFVFLVQKESLDEGSKNLPIIQKYELIYSLPAPSKSWVAP